MEPAVLESLIESEDENAAVPQGNFNKFFTLGLKTFGKIIQQSALGTIIFIFFANSFFPLWIFFLALIRFRS